jgi:hypothetical protein
MILRFLALLFATLAKWLVLATFVGIITWFCLTRSVILSFAWLPPLALGFPILSIALWDDFLFRWKVKTESQLETKQNNNKEEAEPIVA